MVKEAPWIVNLIVDPARWIDAGRAQVSWICSSSAAIVAALRKPNWNCIPRNLDCEHGCYHYRHGWSWSKNGAAIYL